MKIKKLLSVIFAALIICLSITPAVYAVDPSAVYLTTDYEYIVGTLSKYCDINELRDQILYNVSRCEDIDLQRFELPADKTTSAVYNYFYGYFPEAFNANQSAFGMMYAFTNDEGVQCIDSMSVVYKMTASEYQEKLKICQDEAMKLVGDIIDAPISDEEKALIAHDRLASCVEYDNTQSMSYNMSGALINKKAACEGYARCYIYLMNLLGVPCQYTSSNKLNHAWNIVIIDGKKYNVDVTWDDPVGDIYGRVNHEYFLKSTEDYMTGHHKADDLDTTPVDTKYDDWYWDNSVTAFQYYDNSIYYVDALAQSLIKRDPATGEEESVLSLPFQWKSSEGYIYGASAGPDGEFTYCLSRLVSDGTYLFYNSSKDIYMYNPEGSVKVYTIDDSSVNVIGFVADGTTFTIDTSPDAYQYNRADYLRTYVYNKTFTITYDANGGVNAPAPQKGNTLTETIITDAVPSRVGYEFTGWKTEDGKKYSAGDNLNYNNDVTLYAQWSPLQYEITFDSKGGTKADKIKVTFDSAYGKLPDSSKEGYKFLGWFTDKENGNEIKADTIVKTADNHTLYAHWQCNHTSSSTVERIEPTCTKNGNIGAMVCDNCGEITDEGEIIPATGHSWGEPVFNWSEDCGKCSAEFTCKNDASHTETKDCNITIDKKAPTCTADGLNTITASISLDGKTYTDEKDVTVKATGHSFSDYKYNNDATLTADGTKTSKCKNCDETKTISAEGTKLKTKIAIANMSKYNGKALDYKSTITFRAEVENTAGNEIVWYVNGSRAGTGETFTVNKAENGFSIYCATKDVDGNDVTSETETIKINNNFFAKIIAFFKGLFGSLPVITQ